MQNVRFDFTKHHQWQRIHHSIYTRWHSNHVIQSFLLGTEGDLHCVQSPIHTTISRVPVSMRKAGGSRKGGKGGIYRVSQKKWAVSFFYYFPSKTAMTTIVKPLERGRAGKSFKKKYFFKKSILRCFNQYSNFPDMQIRFWL